MSIELRKNIVKIVILLPKDMLFQIYTTIKKSRQHCDRKTNARTIIYEKREEKVL